MKKSQAYIPASLCWATHRPELRDEISLNSNTYPQLVFCLHLFACSLDKLFHPLVGDVEPDEGERLLIVQTFRIQFSRIQQISQFLCHISRLFGRDLHFYGDLAMIFTSHQSVRDWPQGLSLLDLLKTCLVAPLR